MNDDIDVAREISLPGETDTMRLGAQLAQICRAGDVVALWGDLGAGKSTLARALIQKLVGDDTEAPSPTFTLVLTYEATEFTIWHFDLYRLEDCGELHELGFDESADGLAIVEWPQRMGDALPQYRLDIELTMTSTGRTARLVAHGPEWRERLAAFE